MKQTAKDRFLKRIVWFCIFFTAFMIIGTSIAMIYGYDLTGILVTGCGVFGGELLMTCVIKLVGDSSAKKDTKTEG